MNKRQSTTAAELLHRLRTEPEDSFLPRVKWYAAKHRYRARFNVDGKELVIYSSEPDVVTAWGDIRKKLIERLHEDATPTMQIGSMKMAFNDALNHGRKRIRTDDHDTESGKISGRHHDDYVLAYSKVKTLMYGHIRDRRGKVITEDTPMNDVRHAQWEELSLKIRSKGWKFNYRNKLHARLRSLIQHCQHQGYCDYNLHRYSGFTAGQKGTDKPKSGVGVDVRSDEAKHSRLLPAHVLRDMVNKSRKRPFIQVAMLLALNIAGEPHDVARFPLEWAKKLRTGVKDHDWIAYPRWKRGRVYRKFVIWPEVIEAMHRYISQHRNDPLPENKGLLLIRPNGKHYIATGADVPLSKAFRDKLLQTHPANYVSNVTTFLSIRHTVTRVLIENGHSAIAPVIRGNMASNVAMDKHYVNYVDESLPKIRAALETVRQWFLHTPEDATNPWTADPSEWYQGVDEGREQEHRQFVRIYGRGETDVA